MEWWDDKIEGQVNQSYTLTLQAATKAPVIANRYWSKLSYAQAYVDDMESSAVPGLVLSVYGDTDDNNGIWWVKKVATQEGEKGELIRPFATSGGGGGGGIASISFELGSDEEDAVSLDINGEKKSISVDALRTSLGLKSFAYEGIDADDLEGVLSAGDGIAYDEGTISLAPVYNLNVGDFIGVTVDKYGRVTKGKSKIGIDDVTGLSDKLDGINTKFGDYVLKDDYDKDINDSETGLVARIAKIEGWFELDDNNNIRTTYNFYSTKQLASGGIGDASGSGLGLILNEWPTDSEDYSKYALGGNLGIELNTRLTAVEGKATNVTVSPTLSQGKPMGTIMVDGVSQTMYAPASYSADDIVPTQERNFVSLQDIEYWNTAYLPKTGGTLKGSLVPDKDGAYHLGSSEKRMGVLFAMRGVFSSGITINNESVATQAWVDGRYLKSSGGAMSDNASINWNGNTISWDSVPNGLVGISNLNSAYGYAAGLSFKGYYGLQVRSLGGKTDDIEVRGHDASAWGTWLKVIHSGNIGSQSVASAIKLADDTAFTVWGQKFFENGKPKSISMNTAFTATCLNFRNKENDAAAGYVGRGDPSSNNIILFSYTNLKFYTNSTTRMFINSSGNVGIGTASPEYKLDVVGKARVSDELIVTNPTGIRWAYGSYGTLFRNDGANFYVLFTDSGGALDGSWNSLRPFRISLTTGDIVMEHSLSVSKQVNIGAEASINNRFVMFAPYAQSRGVSFGYMKPTIANQYNIGMLHIGTNYGGTNNITDTATDMGAISIYRSTVGIGKEYTYAEIKAIYDAGADLGVNKGIKIGNAILSWDSANNALKIEGNVYATGQMASGGVGTAN